MMAEIAQIPFSSNGFLCACIDETLQKTKTPPPKETKINKSMKEKRPMLLDGSECRGNMTITKAELV